MLGYDKSEKKWYVSYYNDKDEVSKELHLGEEEIMLALAATQESMARLSANAGDKRRKTEGDLVGRRIRKKFRNNGYFIGDVDSYDESIACYRIIYQKDGDIEDISENLVEKFLVQE